MSRSWKSFEIHTWKSLSCHEQTSKDDSGKHPERKEESGSKRFSLLREYFSKPEQNAGSNMNSRGHLKRSQREMRTCYSNPKESQPCYKGQRLTELCLCPNVLGKVEFPQWSKWAIKLGVWLRKYPRKVCKEQPGCSWFLIIKRRKREREHVRQNGSSERKWNWEIWNVLSLSIL